MAHQADVKEVTISPSRAAMLIKRNATISKSDASKINRRLKKRVVTRYASDMKAGRWQFNGETIKLGVDGASSTGNIGSRRASSRTRGSGLSSSRACRTSRFIPSTSA